MLGNSVSLFRLLGFEVKVDFSWVFLAALVSWSLATGYFPQTIEGLSSGTYWSMAIAGAIGLFASIVLHELSHSVVARQYGLPITGITLFIFGGVAEMEREPPTPRAEFMMAIAGPIASIVLAGVFYLLGHIGGEPVSPLAAVARYLGLINLVLAIFNLIPAFPLDGGRALRAVLWSTSGDLNGSTRRTAALGQTFGAVMIGLGLVSLFYGNTIGGIWWALIGFFLNNAARASVAHLETHTLLEAETVGRVMATEPVVVPADTSLSAFADKYVFSTFHEFFPVSAPDGTIVGTITTGHLRNIPRNEWAERTIGEFYTPLRDEACVRPGLAIEETLRHMQRTGLSRLLVFDQDRLVGIIVLRDILRLVKLKSDLPANTAA